MSKICSRVSKEAQTRGQHRGAWRDAPKTARKCFHETCLSFSSKSYIRESPGLDGWKVGGGRGQGWQSMISLLLFLRSVPPALKRKVARDWRPELPDRCLLLARRELTAFSPPCACGNHQIGRGWSSFDSAFVPGDLSLHQRLPGSCGLVPPC